MNSNNVSPLMTQMPCRLIKTAPLFSATSMLIMICFPFTTKVCASTIPMVNFSQSVFASIGTNSGNAYDSDASTDPSIGVGADASLGTGSAFSSGTAPGYQPSLSAEATAMASPPANGSVVVARSYSSAYLGYQFYIGTADPAGYSFGVQMGWSCSDQQYNCPYATAGYSLTGGPIYQSGVDVGVQYNVLSISNTDPDTISQTLSSSTVYQFADDTLYTITLNVDAGANAVGQNGYGFGNVESYVSISLSPLPYGATGYAIIFPSNPTTPLPPSLALFLTGLGGFGLLGWRRKRKFAALAD